MEKLLLFLFLLLLNSQKTKGEWWALCEICECFSSVGVVCPSGTHLSGLVVGHLGLEFPVLDLRGAKGLRPGEIRCSSLIGVRKIILYGASISCGELLNQPLTYCDSKVRKTHGLKYPNRDIRSYVYDAM